MYFKRQIEDVIKANLFKKQIVIIYGARQVGKTTLVKRILEEHQELDKKYFNCDEYDVQTAFSRARTASELKALIGNSQLIVLDESQRILNIGLKLKLLIDTFPEQQVIATGSSAFDLANEIVEPLTGRSLEFWLYPLSIFEIHPDIDRLGFIRILEPLLVFGSYPAVVTATSREDKQTTIKKIATNYLYKDVLKFQNLKSSETVRKLLEALALQLGSEVSYPELSNLIGVSKQTVAAYVDILEAAFIVFKLRPFSRNIRKELGKLRKIYFYDLGVRNTLINNQNPLALRNDTGALWENFVIAEKRKQANFIGNQTLLYFWRTYDQQEVDLVEEIGGKLFGYEIKWSKAKKKPPKAWREGYPGSFWESVTKENYLSSSFYQSLS